MLITTLFKSIDRHSLVICGHLTKQEIASLKVDGWRLEPPQVNKNGIPVQKQKIGGNKHETNHRS